MRLTDEELIEIWKYFQYCCLPSIIMAKYAYEDYLGDIKRERMFYRHTRKQAINKIGKHLERLPNLLMDVNSEHVRYMNILGDNIDEQFEDEKEELHKAIYLSFKNAKMKPLECLAAIHFISAMLQIAVATFEQCCKDLERESGRDMSEIFQRYNLREISDNWEKVVDESTDFYAKANKKADDVDLNNIRCTEAIHAIRSKLSDIETLKEAMRKSYPWSPNYKEGVPYEWSADYIIVNNNQNDNDNGN